jgi:hypothetical protein
MMEAVSTSETLVNFYETTQCNIPEDSQHFCPVAQTIQGVSEKVGAVLGVNSPAQK